MYPLHPFASQTFHGKKNLHISRYCNLPLAKEDDILLV